MTNTEKKAIIINVIYTNRKGEKKTIKMNLRHYLQAKKVRPLIYEPADENSKAIAAKIPLNLIPSGTTQEDVEAFEATKGSIKGKKTNKFDELLDAMERGDDVTELDNVRMIAEKDAVQKPILKKAESVDDLLKDFTDQQTIPKPDAVVESQAPFTRDELDLMDSEQINQIIEGLSIAKKMKEQITRMKDKKAQKDQIIVLLKPKK
jgi:hypothetical protein